MVAHEVGKLAEAAGGAAERVLKHIGNITGQSEDVAETIERTSETLADVDRATKRIDETIAEQRQAAIDAEATVQSASQRLVKIVEGGEEPEPAAGEPTVSTGGRDISVFVEATTGLPAKPAGRDHSLQ